MAVSRINEAGLNVNQYGNRNLIINGAQNVHQRGNQTGLTANAYGTDRFNFTLTGRDELVYNLAQNTDVPSGYGFANSLSFQTTTPESAIASNEYAFISQRIEAQNLQHLAYGTSSAKKVTLSFWVKSSVTGTFCIGLYKDDSAGSLTSQVHNKTYTISSASTWEHKTITFEANTLSGGGITDDSGVGLYVTWHLAAGSNFDSGSSTSSGWANYSTTNWCEPSTTDAVITTTNATFLLTGVQLEVGDTATDFEHRTFGDELQRCLRYFYSCGDGSTHVYEAFAYGTATTTGALEALLEFPVIMRTIPAVAQVGNVHIGNGVVGYTITSLTISSNQSGAKRAIISAGGASGMTQFRAYRIEANNDATARLNFSAEL